MKMADRAAFLLGRLKEKKPLVHSITNYVTANDCANALLAIGASPIMADDPEEAGEIASSASSLVLNMGTPSGRKLEAMIEAGKSANEKGIPVILDPVGAGASRLRQDMALRITREIKISILRGNLSEISWVAGLHSREKGVDVSETDRRIDKEQAAKAASQRLGCITAVTGTEDVVTDGRSVIYIRNGHPALSKVTGTGCMTSALIGAFAGVGEDFFAAAAAGVGTMGIAGEIAFEKAGSLGYGSFHMALLDAVGSLDEKTIRERAKFEER